MSFFSFLVRVLVVSLFILSSCQMFNGFGVDGGSAAKELAPKFDLSSRLSVTLSNIEVRQASVTIASLIAFAGLIFVLRKIFGAYVAFYYVVASPILYDLYYYGPEERHFSPFWIEFLKNFALFGALYLFFMMKNPTPSERDLKKRTQKPEAART